MDGMNIKNCRYIRLDTIRDGNDGVLSIANGNQNIPFDIKRVYYIYDVKHGESIRGKHAHKALHQVLFCIRGSVEIVLDDGEKRQTVMLDKPDLGLYMLPGLWHDMRKFIEGTVLLVFSSDYYEESDYIRDYSDFLKHVLKDKKNDPVQ